MMSYWKNSKSIPPPPGVPSNAIPLNKDGFWFVSTQGTNVIGSVSTGSYLNGDGLTQQRASSSGSGSLNRFRSSPGTVSSILQVGGIVYLYVFGMSGTDPSDSINVLSLVSANTSGGVIQTLDNLPNNLTTYAPQLSSVAITSLLNFSHLEITSQLFFKTQTARFQLWYTNP